jgi:hypothetical protein
MRHVYENLGSFIADAKRTPLNSNPSSRATSGEFNEEWSGTKTFEEAVDLAIHGWPEGRKRLMTAMAAAQSAPAFTPSLAMDVAGAYPIAALAAAGDPCSMVDLQPVESRVRPIIRLIVQRGGSAAYSAEEFLNYGAAVLSYIEGLEAASFRVEIEVSFAARIGSVDHYLSVIAKRAEEHMEMDRLAYVLTHAAFFRRIAFAVKESTPGIAELLNENAYGLSRSPTPAQVDRTQIILPGVNMVKPGAKELKTPKAALEHLGPMIEEQLRNAGMAPPPLAFGGKEK